MTLAIPDGRFSAYIFDCDGTLADTMPLHYRAWRRLLQEYGAPFPEDLFYQMGGKPTERILEQLRDEYGLRVLDVQQAARRKEEFFLEMIHEVKPIADVVEIALRAHAIIPMAVLLGGLGAAGGLLQRRMGLPDATVQVLQGMIFVSILASDTIYGRIRWFPPRGSN